jgi:hypothetical protein
MHTPRPDNAHPKGQKIYTLWYALGFQTIEELPGCALSGLHEDTRPIDRLLRLLGERPGIAIGNELRNCSVLAHGLHELTARRVQVALLQAQVLQQPECNGRRRASNVRIPS